MSTLYASQIECAGCGEPLSVRLADSLNANRMPEARRWVLERSLLTVSCGECGQRTTAVKPLLYTDFERGLWIQVMPEQDRPGFEPLERDVRAGFAAAFDTGTFPRFVQILGARLQPRVAFGYEELREKVVAADAGLLDTLVEVLKLELFVVNPEILRAGAELLTLDAADEERLRFYFHVFPPGRAGEITGELTVARGAYEALVADIEHVRRCHPALFEGVYVNALRYRFASDSAGGEVRADEGQARR